MASSRSFEVKKIGSWVDFVRLVRLCPNLLVSQLLTFLLLTSCFTLPATDSFAQNKMEYTNPILAGFYPDPSVCRVGGDYYLVNSTFAYYPGIPVFHSRDLVNWKLIGYVIEGKGVESRYDTLGVSRGIFAPAIRYHDGLFYVTCTFVDAGGNFVCTAKNPAGPWSKPVWLPQVSGIDPSLFFDDNGKAYLIYNSVPPEGKPLYEGHRTIRMRGFDTERLRVNDDERILVNGGTDIEEKPVWIEGPHIFKVEGYYYLICAQGGTAENHSEVVFRSKSIAGPFVPYKDNPILTQRDLEPDRKNPITCTGHADFVETQYGTWWAVFLGCQPYPPYGKDYYNTGRETFLAPVTWEDGWPTIIPHGHEVAYHYPYPLPRDDNFTGIPHGGDIEYTDNFDSDTLNLNWEFLRAPHEKWYSLTEQPGCIAIKVRPETVSDKMNPSFIGRRQQNAFSSASAAIDFWPKVENEKAGLLVFQNETHYYFLCKSTENNGPVIQLFRSDEHDGHLVLLASDGFWSEHGVGEVFLKVELHGDLYSFLWSVDPGFGWHRFKDSVDAAFLSTKVAGGFVGCMYSLYATSLGKPSENTAYFNWFKYKGINESDIK